MKLKSTDLILLLLYIDDKSIVSHTRFQKMIFLFEKELYKKYGFDKLLQPNLFNFQPYHYGPYSKRLSKDLEFLNSYGFIEIENYTMDENMNEANEIDGYKQYYTYNITELGKKFVDEKIINKLGSIQLEALKDLKKGINDIDLDNLLSYVYRNYPEMTEQSKIKDRYV